MSMERKGMTHDYFDIADSSSMHDACLQNTIRYNTGLM